jgi:hypothetical protein
MVWVTYGKERRYSDQTKNLEAQIERHICENRINKTGKLSEEGS